MSLIVDVGASRRSQAFRRSVRWMRIACPAMSVAGALIGALAFSQGDHAVACVDAFLVGVLLVLSWVQWRVFET